MTRQHHVIVTATAAGKTFNADCICGYHGQARKGQKAGQHGLNHLACMAYRKEEIV